MCNVLADLLIQKTVDVRHKANGGRGSPPACRRRFGTCWEAKTTTTTKTTTKKKKKKKKEDED